MVASLSEFEKRILLAISGLQEGEVVSYGDVAALAGNAKAPRAVGRFLSKTTYDLPWWRVVRSDGSLAPANRLRQARALEAEGVELRKNRVVKSPLGRFT